MDQLILNTMSKVNNQIGINVTDHNYLKSIKDSGWKSGHKEGYKLGKTQGTLKGALIGAGTVAAIGGSAYLIKRIRDKRKSKEATKLHSITYDPINKVFSIN